MKNNIQNIIKEIEYNIERKSSKIYKIPDEYFYELISAFDENKMENFKTAKNLKELKDISENDIYFPYYKILYLSAYVNSYNLKQIDKCGSFYVDTRPCSEDCAFCPLSKEHYINIKTDNISWKNIPEKIYDFAQKIYKLGVRHFKTVTTGAKSDPRIIPYIVEGVKKVKTNYPDLTICISEGTLDENSLKLLKNAGVDIFNNNLESSREYFKKIVSTHNYDDKLNTIKIAKSLGYKICSGGLFGIGEKLEDRVELFLTLRDLDVDSSPFNIFVPFENLPLTKEIKKKNLKFSKPELFFSIALYRLINPKKRLIIGAGREEFLTRDEQKFALLIGASAVASSGYLSKDGLLHSSSDDDKMFKEMLDNK